MNAKEMLLLADQMIDKERFLAAMGIPDQDIPRLVKLWSQDKRQYAKELKKYDLKDVLTPGELLGF